MVEERVERRLAAILAADVVAYSRLMGEDETGTLAALKELIAVLIDPTINEYKGRIVKLMGDGVLAEFASVVDAVECAIKIQRAMAEPISDLSEERQIVFRIGVNIGDIIIDGDDIYGDGVNIAARLEALSEPGGICLSRAVRDQIRDRMNIALEDLGEVGVKNITRPVRAFRVRLDAASKRSVPVTTKPTLPLSNKPSIAVLPFENMSGDPEQEYFSDGIAEDIITELSKTDLLVVIARNSSFSYRGQVFDIKRIGQELGARYVLEGSVRKVGKRVRVNAQLIDAANASHVWAERYDRDIEDVFALQDEITGTVVASIDTEVRSSERERAHRKPPTDLDVWDLCQRAQWHLYRFTAEDCSTARRLTEDAIKRDKEYAAAHANLAYAGYMEVAMGFRDDAPSTLAKAFESGERAVALSETDAFCHFALGRVCNLLGKKDRAVSEFRKAVALNSSYAPAYLGLGQALYFQGRAAEALPHLEQAIQLSPRDTFLWMFLVFKAWCYYTLDRFEEAEQCARASIRERPQEFWHYLALAVTLVRQGRLEEAGEAVAVAQRQRPGLTHTIHKAYLEPIDPGYRARFREDILKAGLSEKELAAEEN